MTVREFKTIRGLLADRSRWAKFAEAYSRRTGKYADDVNPYNCGPRSSKAVCFCLTGAAKRVYRGKELRQVMQKLAKAVPVKFRLTSWGTHRSPIDAVIAFNDHPSTRHASVLKVVKKAGV